MAEERAPSKDKAPAKEEPKGGKTKKAGKGKKGKLPLFLVLAIVLLGGGFFGMKASKGGKVETKPAIELGDHTAIVNLGPFLVNTRDGTMYLKANVLVNLAKGTALFEAGGHGKGPGIETIAPYVDAIREVLAQQTAESMTSADGERAIKEKIAAAVNEVFHRIEPKPEGKGAKKEEPAPTGEPNPEWHSQTGPVLVVYLTEFVWENIG